MSNALYNVEGINSRIININGRDYLKSVCRYEHTVEGFKVYANNELRIPSAPGFASYEDIDDGEAGSGPFVTEENCRDRFREVFGCCSSDVEISEVLGNINTRMGILLSYSTRPSITVKTVVSAGTRDVPVKAVIIGVLVAGAVSRSLTNITNLAEIDQAYITGAMADLNIDASGVAARTITNSTGGSIQLVIATYP